MAESFSLDWCARLLRDDQIATAWYACAPSQMVEHAQRRAEKRPAALAPAETDELRAFVQPHDPPAPLLKNIERLSQNALVVATGQQAGLFGGPLYTLYKAAGAILWAREIERATCIPCVPVFWVASDDHDFEEVASHAWLDGNGALRRWEMPVDRAADGAPVYDYQISADNLRAFARTFAESLPPGAHADSIVAEIEALANTAPISWEFQFVRLIIRWFGDAGLVPVAPRLAWLRRRGVDLMRREIARPGESARLLIDPAAKLRALGADDGLLHRTGNEANFFVHRGGARLKVAWESDRWTLRHPRTSDVAASHTIEEFQRVLDMEPEAFSPNAALRPLVQDAALPTVAYIGGPAEIIYHAQIGALYEHFGVFRPAVLPRPRAVLIEPRIRRIAEKLGLDMSTCLTEGPETVRRESARRADAEGLRARVSAEASSVGDAIQRLEHTVFEVTGDTGLRAAAAKLREGFEKGSEKLLERADAFLERRHADVVSQADRFATALWPDGSPQEHVLGALSPLLRIAGPNAPAQLLDVLDPRNPGLHAIDTSALGGATLDHPDNKPAGRTA